MMRTEAGKFMDINMYITLVQNSKWKTSAAEYE